MELADEEKILTANIFENPDFKKPALFFGAAVLYTNYYLGYKASGIVLSVHNPYVRIAFPSGNSLSEVSILTVDRTKRDLEIRRLFNRTMWEKYLKPQPLVEGL